MLLHKYKYNYISLDDETERNNFFDQNNIESRKVPQIYYESNESSREHIGGYTDLREHLINEGKINFQGETKE